MPFLFGVCERLVAARSNGFADISFVSGARRSKNVLQKNVQKKYCSNSRHYPDVSCVSVENRSKMFCCKKLSKISKPSDISLQKCVLGILTFVF